MPDQLPDKPHLAPAQFGDGLRFALNAVSMAPTRDTYEARLKAQAMLWLASLLERQEDGGSGQKGQAGDPPQTGKDGKGASTKEPGKAKGAGST